jgi:chorismate dehydratase
VTRPVSIGAVGYLNARPLVFGLEEHPDFSVRFDLPARCADLLHAGETDLGLIPSIELLRAPEGPDAYRVVPDLAVVSRGPVASVALFTTRDMRDVRSIALDTSSRTSVALTRVMCARMFGISPALDHVGPDLPAMLSRADAALIIGDKALFLDSGPVETSAAGARRSVAVEKLDLGDLWFRTTGLPFVYAFWAGRPDAVGDSQVRVLQAARDRALSRTLDIAASYFPDDSLRQQVADRYLRVNIRYSLGPEEREGLERFYAYAAEAGVVPRAVKPQYFGAGR